MQKMSLKKAPVTLIESLTLLSIESESDVVDVIDEHSDPRRVVMDLFAELSVRLRALEQICREDEGCVCELLAAVMGMYQFSQTKALADYLKAIIACSFVPIQFRIDCARCLPQQDSYLFIETLLSTEEAAFDSLPTPVRLEILMYLSDSVPHRALTRDRLASILLDTTLDALFRYKVIQAIETHFLSTVTVSRRRRRREVREVAPPVTAPTPLPEHRLAFLYFATDLCLRFLSNESTDLTYRILACQYLFEKCEPSDQEITVAESMLFTVVESTEKVDDLRADACDVLMQYGTDDARQRARDWVMEIGGGQQVRTNLYRNSQNVHIRSIEQSVQTIVDRLTVYHPVNGKSFTFAEAFEQVKHSAEEEKDDDVRDAVEGALTRISIDRAVYGTSMVTLGTLLSKVWTFIQDSEHRDALEARLREELVDSYRKCSSGYASRLVNVLSGFSDEMTLTISFEDQIVANLEARLNARIRALVDTDRVDQILDEMTIPVIEYDKRSSFLKFFREHISQIRQEMYEEFRTYMDDTDYDFYFRKAIIHYEGCV